jgi:hypothetical protein
MYRPRHRQVDVARVLDDVTDARARVEAGSLDLAPPRV